MASALGTLETVPVWPHFPLPRPGYELRLGCGPQLSWPGYETEQKRSAHGDDNAFVPCYADARCVADYAERAIYASRTYQGGSGKCSQARAHRRPPSEAQITAAG